MIEKQFTINAVYSKSLPKLIGVIRDNDEDMYMTDVVDLLNNLSEENSQLRKENEKLCNFNLHMLLDKKNKEIEQLKSRVKYLERKIDRERTSYQKQHEKWENEVHDVIKRITKENKNIQDEYNKQLWLYNGLGCEYDWLKKENERIKQALLFFIDVANTECSSNWHEDMEKDCQKLFNCSYEEAEEKYGGYKDD